MKNLELTLNEMVAKNLNNDFEADILKYSASSYDYIFTYVIKDNLIFALGYSRINIGNNIAGVYRAICKSIGGSVIYYDGNVIDYNKMYSLDDVINKTKNYINSINNKIQSI